MSEILRQFVYLDYNATTPTSVEVKKALTDCFELEGSFGNPSSIHWAGRLPKLWIREARQHLASLLGVSPLELVFTSGGTESNNTVIQGAFEKVHFQNSNRNEFITSTVEHPSVLKTFERLETLGAKVHYVPVNIKGELDLDFYESVLSDRTTLVSIMAANNETGVMHPLSAMIKKAHEVGALFHSDMVQTLGKVPLDLGQLGLDYASFSAHKFYALKGTGLLFVKKNAPTVPLLSGGAQERHRRGGTENIYGIHALGVMAQKKSEVGPQAVRLRKLRDDMESQILKKIQGSQITAAGADRLPNTSAMVIDGVDGETLLMSLDLKGFAVSTGAACSSGNPEPSPVLIAMGLTKQQAQNSLRVSLGWSTSEEEIKNFIDTLVGVVERLRNISKEMDYR